MHDVRPSLRGGTATIGAIALACACALTAPMPRSLAEPAPGQAAEPQVDAAGKKLMAANGLFQRGLFQLAAQGYAEFLEQYPNHADATAARYAMAICHYRMSEFDKACEPLRQVLADANFKQRDEALAVLGHCELSQKHFDKAVAAFDELLAKYPQSKHASIAGLDRIQAFSLAGQPSKAAESAQKYLAGNPQSSQRGAALYFLATAQRALGQNDRTIETAAQLEKEQPDSPYRTDALLLAGQGLESENKLDAAIETYRRMVAAAPDMRKAEARYVLGSALYKAGQFDPCAAEMTAVIAAGAGDYLGSARLQLGLAQLAGNKPAEARSSLEAVVKAKDAHLSEAQYALAQCDIAEKKFSAAREKLGDLLKMQPAPSNAPQIAMDRALCLISEAKFPDAADELESFRKAHADSPLADQALYREAWCLNQLKKFDQSHALLVLLAGRPQSAFTIPSAELDAENLYAAGKYADAAKAFSGLAGQTKEDVKKRAFTLRCGECAYFAGDYAGSIAILQPALADFKAGANEESRDESRQALLLLGDALLQQSKNTQAAETLSKYIAVMKPGAAESAEAHFKLALALLRGGDAEMAQAALADVTQGSADSPWVQRGLLESGQLFYKSKKLPQAAAALEKLIAAKPPADLAAPAVYILAWIDFDSKKYAEAAARWDSVVKLYGSQPLAIESAFQRGVALKSAGKLAEAATALQAFAADHSDSANAAQARQLAADCLTSLGKPNEALQLLATLASDVKASDSVLYNLAWAQRGVNNFPAAQETYRRLLKQYSTSPLVPATETELGELLYNAKQYDQALELLSKVASHNGADAKILSAAAYRLAWCYDRLGKAEKAAEAFVSFAAGHRDDAVLGASSLLEAGIDYAQVGKFDDARKTLAQFLQWYPADSQASVAMLKLGEVQAELNDYDGSAATYSAFLSKYPADKLAYRAQFGIGWSLENRKQYEAARAAYQKVIAADNGETAARAQFQIGETLLGEGKFEQAIPALLAVDDVYAYPAWSARALLEAGRAFEQLKQPDHAKEQYSQLIKKYKDCPEAQVASGKLDALRK